MQQEIKKINRLNDVYFKYLLGNEKHKAITLQFLNAVLARTEENKFVDIHFIDKEFSSGYDFGKSTRLDILAEMDDKTRINIEVQVCKILEMAERSLYYWSKVFIDPLKKSEDYSRLRKTVAINLLNFKLLDETAWHNIYHISNDKSRKRLTDYLEMHFLELPKFKLSNYRQLQKSDNGWHFSVASTKMKSVKIAISSRHWRWKRYVHER